VNYKTVSGNVTAVAVDPHDASGNTVYIGSDSGGVWKTTDGGTNWTPLTDYLTDASGTPIATAIGALAVDPNNPDTVWAGTGISSTVSTANPGVGLIRSLDAGHTWSQVIASNGTNYFQGARVTKIQISDLNPNNLTQPARVFVSVSQGGKFGPGVYETQDGGKTWTNALNPASMFLDNGKPLGAGFQLASATDVEIDRFSLGENTIWVGLGNVGLVSASASAGVWKSVDGGVSWQQIVGGHDPKGGVVLHQKIPAANDGTSDVGQVLIALPGETEAIGPDGLVHPQGRVGDEGTVYAFIDNRKGAVLSFTTGANLDNCTGIFKSSNGGLSWTHVMLRENIQQDFPANYKPPLLHEDHLSQ
jgi:hypothetical protein